MDYDPLQHSPGDVSIADPYRYSFHKIMQSFRTCDDEGIPLGVREKGYDPEHIRDRILCGKLATDYVTVEGMVDEFNGPDYLEDGKKCRNYCTVVTSDSDDPKKLHRAIEEVIENQ